jgi:hypothetical protein
MHWHGSCMARGLVYEIFWGYGWRAYTSMKSCALLQLTGWQVLRVRAMAQKGTSSKLTHSRHGTSLTPLRPRSLSCSDQAKALVGSQVDHVPHAGSSRAASINTFLPHTG